MPTLLSIPRDIFRSLSGNAQLIVHTSNSGSQKFVCQFNPDEYNIQTQGKFTTQERRENDSPIIQYIGGAVKSLNISLYFDTSETYETKTSIMTRVSKTDATDVSKYTDGLMSLVKIEGKLHRPPIVEFKWGSLYFSGFVMKVNVKYTMFEKGGMPVRAKVDLAFCSQDVSVLGSSRVSPKESPDRTKCIVLTEDKTLFSIAKEEYDDANKWREIAKANQIMNPLKVPAGTVLKVPAILE